MRTEAQTRVAAVFMASILLFPFHGNRATTLPLLVPLVLGGTFLYKARGAPSLLLHGLQGQLLLLSPTNLYSAGKKTVSPVTRTSTATCCCAPGFSCSLQLLHLPIPAAAEPQSSWGLIPWYKGLRLLHCVVNLGGVKTAELHVVYMTAFALLSASFMKKKYCWGFFS